MSRVPGWLFALIVIALVIFVANKLGLLAIHFSLSV